MVPRIVQKPPIGLSEHENGAEGEIRTPEDYSSGFRDRRHTGLGYLGLSIPTASRYLGISGDVDCVS